MSASTANYASKYSNSRKSIFNVSTHVLDLAVDPDLIYFLLTVIASISIMLVSARGRSNGNIRITLAPKDSNPVPGPCLIGASIRVTPANYAVFVLR